MSGKLISGKMMSIKSMENKLPLILLSLNLLFVALILLIINSDNDYPELRNDMMLINQNVSELNIKINNISMRVNEKNTNSLLNQTSSSDEQLILMSYDNVVDALKEVIDTLPTDALNVGPSSANELVTLSENQQIQYEALKQQVKGYDAISFHDLLNKMDQQKLPDEYRNELLSQLVSKLNNNEITADEAIGVNP
jgi:hydrogenase maturation factor HypF (carbamoyltransferase family)